MPTIQKGINIRLRLRSVYWSPTGKSVVEQGTEGDRLREKLDSAVCSADSALG